MTDLIGIADKEFYINWLSLQKILHKQFWCFKEQQGIYVTEILK